MSRIHGVRQIQGLTITNASISASAGIVDTKLDTIATAGKVSNSATTATTADTLNTIVLRDGSGTISVGSGAVRGILPAVNGGTGIANSTGSLTFDSALTFAGSDAVTFNTNGALSYNLPGATGTIATEEYVDAVATGLAIHEPVRVATSESLEAHFSDTFTYDNGTSGVGATLTSDSNASINTVGIDGATNLVVNDRVLVKNQALEEYNGIYLVSDLGSVGVSPFILIRAADFDQTGEVHDGDFVFVGEGTVNGDSGFVQTEIDPITIGVGDIIWQQFSGAGQITAGNGLDKTGNTIFIHATYWDDVQAINTLDMAQAVTDGLVNADLDKLADLTATAAEINELNGAGADNADFVKLAAITKSAAEINDLVEATDLAASGGAATVGNNPSGNLAATTVQAALNELQGDIDTINTATSGITDYDALGAGDNATVLYTVTNGSYLAGSLNVYLNGLLMKKGAGAEEYQETTPASGTFTFGDAPKTNDDIIVSHR